MPRTPARNRSTLTLDKIADELGLSRVTVSSVINGKARERRISEGTVSRVNALLIRRGFVPSRQAVELRMQARETVGILHTGHLYSHLTEAFNLLTEHYSGRPGGLEIMVVSPDQALAGLRELIGRRIKSLVWIQASPPQVEHVDPSTLFGLLSNVTTVIYNHRFEVEALDRELIRRGIYLVGADRRRGIQVLASRVRALGHRCAVLPDIDPDWLKGDGRVRKPVPYIIHFAQAFEKRGVRIVAARPPMTGQESAEAIGQKMADAVLAVRRRHPATVACFRDDEISAFALAHLMGRGLRIPQALSVTGIDDLRLASAFRIGLTTLRIPVAEMVRRTTEVLARRPSTFCHQLEVPLIERDSLAAPPASVR